MRWSLASSGIVFAVFLFTALIAVKNDVRQLTRERKMLNQQNQILQEELRVMQAELAYLTSPIYLDRYQQSLKLVELKTKNLKRWEATS